MLTVLRRLVKEEEGQSLVEYALILALVSVISIVALQGIGTKILDVLNYVKSALDAAV